MLFLLKVDQKNKPNQSSFSKVEKLRDFFNKVRLVAKNFIYVKKWSNKKIETSSCTNISRALFPNSRLLDIDLGRFNLKIINDSHPLIDQVKELRQKSFFQFLNSIMRDVLIIFFHNNTYHLMIGYRCFFLLN